MEPPKESDEQGFEIQSVTPGAAGFAVAPKPCPECGLRHGEGERFMLVGYDADGSPDIRATCQR